jgi:hypothetical protein
MWDHWGDVRETNNIAAALDYSARGKRGTV